MNKQLLLLQQAQFEPIELLPSVLLKQTKNASQAALLMVNYANGTHESIASEMGKSRETVTRFINDNGGLKPTDLSRLIGACGNAYLLQFLAEQHGFELVAKDKLAHRKAELMAELQSLERIA